MSGGTSSTQHPGRKEGAATSKRTMSSGRLVVISNRVGPVKAAARAGGLAVALVEALRARGGLWCGWSGKLTEVENERVTIETHGRLSLATADLTQDEYDDYYGGFANRCLWPLFHYRIDLTSFDRGHFSGYSRVNAKFARAFRPLLNGDDQIWVHDYHLIPLAEELRGMGAQQPIGFFLHIPFPSREVLLTLPLGERLIQSLFAYDVIGLQTERDVQRFIDYVVNEFDAQIDGDRLTAFGRTAIVKAFPIGIDVDTFARYAVSGDGLRQFNKLRTELHGRQLIIGADRLDYTKGLPDRFHAFAALLEAYPETHGRLEYMQVAPISRGEVPEYAAIRSELEGLAGHINGQYAEIDWQPLRYINRSYSRPALAGIYRAAHIGLVTPLRDGMNLVAKEYVAAQDPADPGVLVLSRFAGAAKQMSAAIIVNPYDVYAVAEALQRALRMPLDERRNRHAELFAGLKDYDISRWREEFLATLNRTRRPQ